VKADQSLGNFTSDKRNDSSELIHNQALISVPSAWIHPSEYQERAILASWTTVLIRLGSKQPGHDKRGVLSRGVIIVIRSTGLSVADATGTPEIESHAN